MNELEKPQKNHIKIRILIPIILFILAYCCNFIKHVQTGFGLFFVLASLTILSVIFLFFETIFFFIKSKKNHANANLMVFGLLILLVILIWFFYIIYQNSL